MSEYLINSFEYIKTLSFTDIEKANIDWSTCRIPVNYKHKVMSYNLPLSESEFMRETNSRYQVKMYQYNYRWPQELTEDALKNTFINTIVQDKLTK